MHKVLVNCFNNSQACPGKDVHNGADSPEPSMLDKRVRTKISCAGSFCVCVQTGYALGALDTVFICRFRVFPDAQNPAFGRTFNQNDPLKITQCILHDTL